MEINVVIKRSFFPSLLEKIQILWLISSAQNNGNSAFNKDPKLADIPVPFHFYKTENISVPIYFATIKGEPSVLKQADQSVWLHSLQQLTCSHYFHLHLVTFWSFIALDIHPALFHLDCVQSPRAVPVCLEVRYSLNSNGGWRNPRAKACWDLKLSCRFSWRDMIKQISVRMRLHQ